MIARDDRISGVCEIDELAGEPPGVAVALHRDRGVRKGAKVTIRQRQRREQAGRPNNSGIGGRMRAREQRAVTAHIVAERGRRRVTRRVLEVER